MSFKPCIKPSWHQILRVILRGQHPPPLTLKWLKQFRALPIDWAEQRVLLGFDQSASGTVLLADSEWQRNLPVKTISEAVREIHKAKAPLCAGLSGKSSI